MISYCVVSHTHWDREWYLPFENFRMRLVDLIDHLLDILRNDSEYRFHLDAQTIVLEDYLEIRPGRREELEKHIRDGRILVGPWYIQNDFYLTSGEATVRNLIIGKEIARKAGRCTEIGYAADQFGLISQLPQILSGFGMDTCVFGRGFSMNRMTPLEFFWESPDGTRVLCEHMAFWYNNAQRFPGDPEGALILIRNCEAAISGRALTENYLLMNGVDHLEAQENLNEIIEKTRPLLPEDAKLFQDTLPEFMARVRESLSRREELPEVFTGELRHGGPASVLSGTLSARADLKLINTECQTRIENIAEPLCALCDAIGVASYPLDYMRYMWKLLLQNHPHDSICGCSVDAVHRHMLDRFERFEECADDIILRYMRSLAEHAACTNAEGYRITVFNPVQSAWEKPVRVRAEFLSSDAIENFRIVSADGKEIPYIIDSFSPSRGKRILSPINLPGEKDVDIYDLTLDTPAVPGFSYRIYTVEKSGGQRAPECQPDGNYIPERIENERFSVVINENGTVDLTDKSEGAVFRGLFMLEDAADRGDAYNCDIDKSAGIFTSTDCRCRITSAVENPLVSSRTVEFDMPSACGEDKTIYVKAVYSLQKGGRELECELTVCNQAENHRFRVLFPTGIDADKNISGAPFDRVERNRDSVYPDDFTHPDTGYVCLEDDIHGFAVINSGMYEYEHTPEGIIALTVLRAVDRITGSWDQRDRQMETWKTSDSQMKGEIKCRMAVRPYRTGSADSNIAADSVSFRTPPLAVVSPMDIRKFSGGRPFVQISGVPDLFFREPENVDITVPDYLDFLKIATDVPGAFLVTAVKKSEDGLGMVVRGYNLTGAPVSVKLSLFCRFERIEKLTLEEIYSETLSMFSDSATAILRPKEILTVGFFRRVK